VPRRDLPEHREIVLNFEFFGLSWKEINSMPQRSAEEAPAAESLNSKLQPLLLPMSQRQQSATLGYHRKAMESHSPAM